MSLSQTSLFEASVKINSVQFPAMTTGRASVACPFNFQVGYSQVLGFRLITSGGTRTQTPVVLSVGPATATSDPATTIPHIFIGAGGADASIYALFWTNNDPNEFTKSALILQPPV